jgi:dTDP-4-amino-4,6-dideoxygalactose transaminase
MEKVSRKIDMVDLVGQYEKIKSEVDSAINEVIHSSKFINGPEVKSFQAELESYLGVKHVIPCANGTDALQIAVMAADLKPGDEVITPNFTFAATVEVVAFLGITPVFVDVDPETFNMDIEALEKAITPNTKAIIPVHLFGQCADMESILAIAKKHNLLVIEDTAQAIGSNYTFADGTKKKSGTMGQIGTTSFFPSKNLGCYGDGGAIFTNNDDYAQKCRMIANHGQRVQYSYEMLGINSRLDSLQAAILRIKLKHLDTYTKARQAVAAYYDKAFAGHAKIKTPGRNPKSDHVFHQYTLTLNGVDRTKLKDALAAHDIPAMIYYPSPLHTQKAYVTDRSKNASFPVTERLCANVISLPMHTELNEATLQYITQTVLDLVK